jgi:glycosyltransferase involved in cell wall biosynthesis
LTVLYWPKVDGNWSGGGAVFIRNLEYCQHLFPEVFSDSPRGAVPIIARNVVPPGLIRSRYVLIPQNAWPWHGPWGDSFQEVQRRIQLRLASTASIHLATSVVRISSAIPAPPRRVLGPILHNVLDEEFEHALKCSSSVTSQWLDNGSPPYIFSPGSLDCYRNFPFLIRAWAEYRKAGGSCELLIVGSAPTSKATGALLQLANECGAQVKTESLPRHAVLAHMRAARLTVLPSLVEASPVSLLEAIVCSRRVIASDIVGHRELSGFVRGSVGLFDPTDIESLISALGEADTDEAPDRCAMLSTPVAREQLRAEWSRGLIERLGLIQGLRA